MKKILVMIGILVCVVMAGSAWGDTSTIMLQGRCLDSTGAPTKGEIMSVQFYDENGTYFGSPIVASSKIKTGVDGYFSFPMTLDSVKDKDVYDALMAGKLKKFHVVAAVGSDNETEVGPFVISTVPSSFMSLNSKTVGGLTTREIINTATKETVALIPASAWSSGARGIFYNGNSVGVGTSEPTARFEVVGNNAIKGTYSGDPSVYGILGDPAQFNFNGQEVNGNWNQNWGQNGQSYDYAKPQDNKSLIGVYGQSGTNNAGMLGVNFISPFGLSLMKAGVYGKSNDYAGYFEGKVRATGTVEAAYLKGDGSQITNVTGVWTKYPYDETFIYHENGNVAIGTTDPVKQLTVKGDSYFNGNVGIGTKETRSKVDIYQSDKNGIAVSGAIPIKVLNGTVGSVSGYLGKSEADDISKKYGVYGQYYNNLGDANYRTYGYIGSENTGVYGRHNSGNFGALGAQNYGAYGSGSQYGVYGTSSNFGVYGMGKNSGVRGQLFVDNEIVSFLGDMGSVEDIKAPYFFYESNLDHRLRSGVTGQVYYRNDTVTPRSLGALGAEIMSYPLESSGYVSAGVVGFSRDWAGVGVYGEAKGSQAHSAIFRGGNGMRVVGSIEVVGGDIKIMDPENPDTKPYATGWSGNIGIGNKILQIRKGIVIGLVDE